MWQRAKKKLVVIHPGISARACKGQPSSIGRAQRLGADARNTQEGGRGRGRESEAAKHHQQSVLRGNRIIKMHEDGTELAYLPGIYVLQEACSRDIANHLRRHIGPM